jgi:hypothetical protein
MSVGKIKLEQVATTTETAMRRSGSDYTPAGGKILQILTVRVFNNDDADKYCKIRIGATYLTGTKAITAQDGLVFSNLNEFLEDGEKIYIQGEADNVLQVRMNGLEVDT